jgi:hypothetical protein
MSRKMSNPSGSTKVRYRAKDGTEKVYYYDYYETAEERALAVLKTRPLRRLLRRSKWTAGQRGPVFADATVVRLIQKGLAVCFGNFVELKGRKR